MTKITMPNLPPLTDFIPTRTAGMQRLADFLPRAGRAYETGRNYDFGPNKRDNISMLSPYIRHRLITEEEVVEATLAQHSFAVAEKFIQEVYWRTYWKGWLEHRPGVWHDYLIERDQTFDRLAASSGLRKVYDQAIEGRTGIEGFDDWAQELVTHGYLHNHARMWFASIWIFTLKLPWVLGADFSMQHLCDADPASNTLSWRWVGGLQTLGKVYAAAQWNIEKFSGGRFSPTGLVDNPVPLEAGQLPNLKPIVWPAALPDGPFVMAVTEDDCGPLPAYINEQASHVVRIKTSAYRSKNALGKKADAFLTGALDDGASRLASHNLSDLGVFSAIDTGEVLAALRDVGAKTLCLPYATVGSSRDGSMELKKTLEQNSIRVVTFLRDYDRMAWPYATKGFFAFKAHIPQLTRSNNQPLFPF